MYKIFLNSGIFGLDRVGFKNRAYVSLLALKGIIRAIIWNYGRYKLNRRAIAELNKDIVLDNL